MRSTVLSDYAVQNGCFLSLSCILNRSNKACPDQSFLGKFLCQVCECCFHQHNLDMLIGSYWGYRLFQSFYYVSVFNCAIMHVCMCGANKMSLVILSNRKALPQLGYYVL